MRCVVCEEGMCVWSGGVCVRSGGVWCVRCEVCGMCWN